MTVDWFNLDWQEQSRELHNLRERIRTEPDHVAAVEMALSCPMVDGENGHIFADIMLTRSMLALINQLQEEMS